MMMRKREEFNTQAIRRNYYNKMTNWGFMHESLEMICVAYTTM